MKATLENMVTTSKNGDHAMYVPEEAVEVGDLDLQALERVFKALQPGAVFSEPVVSGQYTVITASELSAGGGFGIGKGVVPAVPPAPKKAEDTEPSTSARRDLMLTTSWGGGGGGGASGRPVAIIVIGPEGVKVEPVFDVTKIVIASLAMWRGILPMLFKKGKRR